MKLMPATLLLSLSVCAWATQRYDLEPGATRVGFDIERFGLHWISARFSDFHGDFVFDRDGKDSRVDVTVQIDSIDCGSLTWNPRLRSPEWLDVAHYPQMIYHSRQVRFDSDDRAEASGELTLHGVTRPVVLSVTELQCPGGSAGSDHCRFTARTSLRRSDYGLPHSFWTGGDQVDITITGVGTRSSGAARDSLR